MITSVQTEKPVEPQLEWGVEFTYPSSGTGVRGCQNEQHARNVLATLPGQYRPAHLVHRCGDSWVRAS